MRLLRNGFLALGIGLGTTGCFDKDKLTGNVLTFELTARKDYKPIKYTDGIFRFPKDTKFQIPAKLEVVYGNSGNHKSYLFFKKQKDKKESKCEYRGGSSQSEPKGPNELDKAKFYRLVKCDDGLKAEDIATAQDLRLRVDHGGNSKDAKYVIAKAVIVYEGAATPTPSPSPTPRVTPTAVPTATPTLTPTASPTPDIFAGLPPDPGEAGKATLQGIDADNDGVRDDVQRFIKASYPNSLPQRRAATQFAKHTMASLRTQDGTTPEVHAWAAKDLRNSECLDFLFGGFSIAVNEQPKIKQAVLNTDARNRAHIRWLKQMGGFYGSLVQDGQEASTCDFNTLEQ